MTPLHLAVIGGHLDVCGQCGSLTRIKAPPPHWLICAQVVARLLAAGADVSLEDKRGRTALSYAEQLHSAATPRTREMELLSRAP